MKHKFSVLILSISGECEECKQHVRSSKALSLAEMDQVADRPSKLRAYKLELAYAELDQHKCETKCLE